jgi:sugar O-acyltransferase (sialic acid O-acetyltransferase NeuD family)
MPTERLFVVGAGGHGRVVMDALLASEAGAGATFVDDDPALQGRQVLGRAVEASAQAFREPGFRFHVAIGANAVRAAMIERLQREGGRSTSVVHPSARLSSFCVLGDGVFVAAGAIVGPDAEVGAGTIVNHGAVVDHDCRVGPCSHLAPNATLAGGVTVGRSVLVGAGANLLPGITVDDDAVIGAGAVVLADVPANSSYAGVPARRLEEKTD